ncbi:ABC transporter substrate-binding protein [Paralimibaculum aggregatum]|uniref:ABC transporter substrate-binding protein n=1 Tax=Paralimibaculum aggregatum TaxID=3036245 RepID=A0ABQ6LM59_9RHOB|nr:ABC transporter substrate-binding protein [Limibaculum sp. NKW23]GMG84285.1 ABC transporter substrate-binding protein [Limibaculum sp. NKW23]
MAAYRPISRRRLLQSGAGAAALTLASPAILRAQSDKIRFGHLTPRTGFLGPLGEYAAMASRLAVDEINAAGGVMGREIELLQEDSVNPQTASTKAERMIERDGVACIVGEISSSSGLTIGQVAQRTGTLFVNTGCNSDALRGSDCKKFMFHIEAQNSMYVKSIGQFYTREGLVEGKRWFSMTADYAFGHDLLKVAKRFMTANGGTFAGDELVPTDATDFSAYMLQIRAAEPDLVILNLAGQQTTNFFKQYAEFGLDYPLGGFGFDMALAWAAGKGNFVGSWPSVWHHRVETDGSRAFVKAFTDAYGKPPENQAWGDYNAVKIIAQSMEELGTTDSAAIVEHFESEASFDVLKTREGYFRKRDHQFMNEMYGITALPPDQIENQWDIFTSSDPVPGTGESLELIAATEEENTCTFPS